jgi:hypothetical protein
MDTFKATWDNHIPVNPPTKNTKIYAIDQAKTASTFKAPLTNVSVQLTTLIVAGNEIIIVIVLYNDLLL